MGGPLPEGMGTEQGATRRIQESALGRVWMFSSALGQVRASGSALRWIWDTGTCVVLDVRGWALLWVRSGQEDLLWAGFRMWGPASCWTWGAGLCFGSGLDSEICSTSNSPCWDQLHVEFGTVGSAPHQIQDIRICFVLDLGLCVLVCVKITWGQGPSPGSSGPEHCRAAPRGLVAVCLSITTQRGTAPL